MRDRIRVFLGVLALVTCGFGPPAAAGSEAEIEAAYRGIARAVAERDVAAFMAYLAPEVEWRYPDGTVQKRAEIEAVMKDFILSRSSSHAFRFKLLGIKDQQGEVVADAILQEGDTRYRRTDTWRKTRSGWKNTLGFESVIRD